MHVKLEVYYHDYRSDPFKPDNVPDFCWTAHFQEEGITAYGKTMQQAIDKAVEMLKFKNQLEAKASKELERIQPQRQNASRPQKMQKV